MRSQFRRSRNVFVRLEMLEKRFVVQKEVNDPAKIMELLRHYEELLETERNDPNYGAEREQEEAEEIMKRMINEGLIVPGSGESQASPKDKGQIIEHPRSEENAQ